MRHLHTDTSQAVFLSEFTQDQYPDPDPDQYPDPDQDLDQDQEAAARR